MFGYLNIYDTKMLTNSKIETQLLIENHNQVIVHKKHEQVIILYKHKTSDSLSETSRFYLK